MSQKMTLLVAACLTGFVLLIGGAVGGALVTRLSQPTTASAAQDPLAAAPISADTTVTNSSAAAAVPDTTTVSSSTSPDVQTLLEREAQYQELIRQANERLAKMNAVEQPAPSVQVNVAAPVYAVSSDQAAGFALQAVPNAVITAPVQLVNFQGVMAYAVSLSKGIVYIDANTGQIIFNSAIVAPTGPIASTGGSGRSHASGNRGSGGGGGSSGGGGGSSGGGGDGGGGEGGGEGGD